jgi:hypothetical protein
MFFLEAIPAVCYSFLKNFHFAPGATGFLWSPPLRAKSRVFSKGCRVHPG